MARSYRAFRSSIAVLCNVAMDSGIPGQSQTLTSGRATHDGFGRTATVYGELDAENFASANLMALSQNLMPLLLEAVEIVRSNHIGNARAETLLAELDSQ